MASSPTNVREDELARTHKKQRKAWEATGAKHRTTHRAAELSQPAAAQTAPFAPSPVTRAQTSRRSEVPRHVGPPG
eukprot:488661-Hanusia_phi.AAC.1